MEWLNILVQGVLLGDLYALFAAGLSLMFGVMRFINIAHGDFIVVAAYLMLVVVLTLGLPPVLVTFGLSIIIQNSLLEAFSADSQRVPSGGCCARPRMIPTSCR